MTKLVILSDSHNTPEAVRRILRADKGCDAVIYLGDGLKDIDHVAPEFACTRVYSVAGNCDYGALEPQDGLAAFDGVLIYYTHGHLYGVKYDLDTLMQAAKARGADIALFGHTHTALSETRDGVLLFNPGSCGHTYGGGETYGVLTLDTGKLLSAEHKKVPKE